MASQIEKTDKQYGVVMAWHNETEIHDLLTKEICFPWQAELAQSYYQVGTNYDGSPIFSAHKGHFLPISSDLRLPLGNEKVICVDSYSIRTPQAEWDYMESVLKGTKFTVVSAGTVCNRGKFFISVKLNELEDIRPIDGNKVEMIANFLGSLDQSLNRHLNLSGIRTVCANTLMMNYLAKTPFSSRIKHSKNMAKKIDENTSVLEKAIGYSAVVKAIFDSLIAKPCTKDHAREIYAGFLVNEANRQALSAKKELVSELSTRMENQVDEHVRAFEKGKGNSGVSEYDLLNGFTEPRSTGFSYGETNAFKTFESSEFGTFARQKGEFAALLTSNRGELPQIETLGRSILGSSKIAVSVN